MRKVLNFIKSKDDSKQTAFYLTKNKIIIFGCHNIGNICNNITNTITDIDIIITDLNDFKLEQLNYLKRFNKVSIIFPNKNLITNLIKTEILYEIKTPNEINEYYLKEYENKTHPSYGYHFIYDNDNLFYSNTLINNEIFEMFKNKKVYYLYQNISKEDLNKLKYLKDYYNRITCICNNELINLELYDE